jgi:hypothetical protein
MKDHSWVNEFGGAVTVFGLDGTILAMNHRAAQTFADQGGADLIGQNGFDCHPAPARAKLQQLMDAQKTNAYTIEKKGVKKLIYQAPWFEEGEYRGFVELSLELPAQLPHFVRDGA